MAEPRAGRPGPGAARRPLVLEAGDARVTVRPADGGRIGSMVVFGTELLVTSSPEGPIHWGAYPMAPWAGRIRHGRFAFAGRTFQLPLSMPPHAIHGITFDRPWDVLEETAAAATIGVELADPWPFRGRVEQRFELHEDGLDVTMILEARDAMPAAVGWHPWFRRVLVPHEPPVRLVLEADRMLVRDPEGIPTGELVAPPPGPWDDAFTGLRSDPVLEWPGRLRLALSSSCRWWVVYTVPADAVCVEPQSGPPDAPNWAPEVVEPGERLRHTMRWRWTRLSPTA
jgi:aldose 1-epimerase